MHNIKMTCFTIRKIHQITFIQRINEYMIEENIDLEIE